MSTTNLHNTGTALKGQCSKASLKNICLAPGLGSPIWLEILQYYTMILQHPRVMEGDAGFKPRTSAPMSHNISISLEFLFYESYSFIGH